MEMEVWGPQRGLEVVSLELKGRRVEVWRWGHTVGLLLMTARTVAVGGPTPAPQHPWPEAYWALVFQRFALKQALLP